MGQATLGMYITGVSHVSAVLLERLLPLDEEQRLGLLLQGTPCRS